MDMLAVPDFSAGAMENWGLVTYRTVMLLVDPNNTSSLTQQRVAYVVAHELAHQWFGNLVTMEWWDELWLNEGFATWVGWYAVDHFFPSWQVWSQFVNNELGKALELDALQSSHPIQVPVFRPSEISQIFDSISYSKGASVIRMLSTWLGVDLFIQGVAVYLHRHQYKNAATEDLWDALNEATGKNVREFMTLWTKQVGYPVLDISLETKKKDAVSGNTPRVLRVQQARFLTGSQSTPASLSSTREDTVQKPWWCPLGLVHVEGAMLKATEDQFFLPPDSSDPLDSVLNVGQSNFYRVHYPKELLDTFCEWNQQLHEVDRAGLISDAFSLSMHGEYTSLVPLQFVEAESTLIQKRQSSSSSVPFSYIALLQIEAGLSKMKEVWAFEPSLPHFKKMLRQVFSPVVQYLGWEFTTKDDHLHGLLRTLAISTAGLNEDMVVVQQALRYVQDDVLLKQVHPNLRGSAYAMAIKHGGMEYYHRIQQQVYLNEQLTMDQRLSALSALGYLQQESDIKTLLEFVFEKVRTQDWIYPFRTASMQHRLFVWRYLKQRWDKLEAVFQPSMLAHTVHLTSGWADMQLATTEIISFFKQRNTALYDRALQQALEKIKMQEAWLNKDRDAVSEWLQSHLYTKP
ncbi:hypothetical protein HMI54_002761 [Coelomomyces lativittatus]|nr:hypothetical protein HMI54_002761 [Coelomomyces lativittatus]